ncbi:pimeloyl-ACP methyl ester carboxylesterase [Streptosporangium becharense]|uniref:Pimeloyl-ACP methyl ester carboxylesterase n=1 Tax=Streptosporangium becharense TaxID=1816182 RepID=A0A7W9MI82_9ACTN|nr:alpha/beta hydrolase [Streptosporangium becharense]MBB2913529.1 pimeloyl-ACP methyl ester carboxylesterase [Streptosporangium becharense]MBB5821219.1 pimeloyl-ACP methyl ester carboxylesterase [Streptosporangium becharense]
MSTPRFLTLPPGVRSRQIETALGTFAALEALPVSGIPERWPALLVPGLTGSKEDFIAVLQTLAQAGRQVVAVDMRGQFETTGPDDSAAYTCAALGNDIDVLAQVIGQDGPIHLVGHSFGGLVTREAVIDGRTRFASYTLMSSGPAAIIGPRERAGRAMLSELPETGLEHMWHNRLEPEALSAGVPDEIVAFLRKRFFANSVTGMYRMTEEVLSAPDRCDELTQIDVPTLVLYGEHDDGWPPRLQSEMARRLNADCVVVPGAAHSPAVEAPETTAAALTRFWNAAESRRSA